MVFPILVHMQTEPYCIGGGMTDTEHKWFIRNKKLLDVQKQSSSFEFAILLSHRNGKGTKYKYKHH